MLNLTNGTEVPPMIYGEFNVPFDGSESFSADASIVMTASHWWIPQFEIPFLIIIILIGIIGNISIIGAIFIEKKLKFAGNAFIVNLAVADLIVTAYVLPGVLTNVIMNRNMFRTGICSFTALILSISCIASMYSLMCVAMNRYVAIVKNTKYTAIFDRKKIAIMIFAVWAWAFLISIPPAFGWGDYRYHKKIHVCMYDCNTEKYLSFTVSYICLSIIVPFLATCFCYRGVFVAFNKNRAKVRAMSQSDVGISTETKSTSETKKKRSQSVLKREDRERRLVITLFTAVTLFTICWLPYALLILIDHHAPAFYKRSTAWLAFTNSAMNSILYGVMNQNFRNGYKKLWAHVFCCCGFQIHKKMLDTSVTASKPVSNDVNRIKTIADTTILTNASMHSQANDVSQV